MMLWLFFSKSRATYMYSTAPHTNSLRQHTYTMYSTAPHAHTVPGNIHTYSTVPHVRTVPGNIYMCSGGVVFGLEVAGYLAKKVSRGTFNTYIYRKGYSVFRIRTCTLWCASTTHNQPIITESKVVHYTFKAILSIPVL